MKIHFHRQILQSWGFCLETNKEKMYIMGEKENMKNEYCTPRVRVCILDHRYSAQTHTHTHTREREREREIEREREREMQTHREERERDADIHRVTHARTHHGLNTPVTNSITRNVVKPHRGHDTHTTCR